jgi:hypothetical protein
MRSFPPYDLPSLNISSVSGDSLPRSWSALREMGVTYRTGALPKFIVPLVTLPTLVRSSKPYVNPTSERKEQIYEQSPPPTLAR